MTNLLEEFRRQLRESKAMENAVAASADRKISLTDPAARAIT
jgi:hypothetical protein